MSLSCEDGNEPPYPVDGTPIAGGFKYPHDTKMDFTNEIFTRPNGVVYSHLLSENTNLNYYTFTRVHFNTQYNINNRCLIGAKFDNARFIVDGPNSIVGMGFINSILI